MDPAGSIAPAVLTFFAVEYQLNRAVLFCKLSTRDKRHMKIFTFVITALQS
jgi:hypothetical protein